MAQPLKARLPTKTIREPWKGSALLYNSIPQREKCFINVRHLEKNIRNVVPECNYLMAQRGHEQWCPHTKGIQKLILHDSKGNSQTN